MNKSCFVRWILELIESFVFSSLIVFKYKPLRESHKTPTAGNRRRRPEGRRRMDTPTAAVGVWPSASATPSAYAWWAPQDGSQAVPSALHTPAAMPSAFAPRYFFSSSYADGNAVGLCMQIFLNFLNFLKLFYFFLFRNF